MPGSHPCAPSAPRRRLLDGRTRPTSPRGEGIMSQQSPWAAFRSQDPRQSQGQPQYPPQPVYLQQQDPGQQQGQSPYPPQQAYRQQPPPAAPPRGQRSGQACQSWPWQRKAMTTIGGIFGFFVLIAAISAAAHGGTGTKTA